MASRSIFGALARRHFLITRQTAGAFQDLREIAVSGIGSTLDSGILSKVDPHRCGSSCAGKCVKSYDRLSRLRVAMHVQALTPLCRSFSSTVEDSVSKTDPDHSGEDSASESDVEQSEKAKEEAGDESASYVKVYRPELTPEEIQLADEIGYKVLGPTKPWEGRTRRQLIFSVVQIGSHQFKVSRGDCIYTEKLKYAAVNDKLMLNKVLMLGTKSQTIIGRPILPDAAVHAVVEEQALDAEVIIFKKKRRKNYRRTNYHRQELTRLRITGVKGLKESLGLKESSEVTAVAA
eukprot:Gb_38840 [translate_table: standard]